VNKIVIDIERCKGCYLCADTCPEELLVVCDQPNAGGYYPVRISKQEACNACGLCATVCPDAAIAVYKEIKKKQVK